jgi:hypothetical protein
LIQRIDCQEQEGAIAIRAQCMCRGTIDRRMLDTSVVLVVVRAIVRVAPRLSEWTRDDGRACAEEDGPAYGFDWDWRRWATCLAEGAVLVRTKRGFASKVDCAAVA